MESGFILRPLFSSDLNSGCARGRCVLNYSSLVWDVRGTDMSTKYRFLALLVLVAGVIAAAALLRADRVMSRSNTVTADAPPFIGAPSIELGASARKVSSAVISDLSERGSTPVVVMLDSSADTSVARQIDDWNERGWFVYKTLKEHAESSQADLREFFDSRGIPYRSYWAANMIAADVDQTSLIQLAQRADVGRIDSNLPTRWIEDPEIDKGILPPFSISAPDGIEWGVTNVKAPEVWGLGFRGQGIVVGGLDTGVRWTHSSIKSKYRGWNGTTADHNYNWWDSVDSGGGVCGPNNVAPCDDNGHGTHTVGTILGDDGGSNQIGVAPDAKWIGCRNMNAGNGTPATYTECFQFMIAPTDSAGNNPDPTKRPHILNNSWRCTIEEGCESGGELEAIVQEVVIDAGIFMVVSAGNSGPGCSSIASPPAFYDESFSVGATDSNNYLASFSSRGPSPFYDPAKPKPNISAPGANVRSALSNSDVSFGSKFGTSMAAPHVAGVVALLWSARPSLIGNIEETRQILQNTANPNVSLIGPQTCGGVSSEQVPNNSFGYGRVDALAPLKVGLSGRVVTPSGAGLRGASVILRRADGSTQTTLSSSIGYFSFGEAFIGESYTISVSSKRYRFLPVNVLVTESMGTPDIVGEE